MSPAWKIAEPCELCELAKRFAARTLVVTPADSNKMPPTDTHAYPDKFRNFPFVAITHLRFEEPHTSS
jgi:hypothetical protein